MTRRFTCIRNGANKFWEIEEPQQTDDTQWAVSVKFGRIGSWGQERVHVENGKYSARSYYMDKVAEKERKGYKEAGHVAVNKSVVTYQPTYIPAPKPTSCKHDSLTRSGAKWKCGACKKEVDFGKDSAPVSSVEFEVVTKVRRFFDLSRRQDESTV
jgi:predicted DNA-binding WGR domain protein